MHFVIVKTQKLKYRMLPQLQISQIVAYVQYPFEINKLKCKLYYAKTHTKCGWELQNDMNETTQNANTPHSQN